MPSGICDHCNKVCPSTQNYCDTECVVGAAKAAGGVIYCPNNLPIVCVRHDNAMLEHEHSDHPDYKFPVNVEYIGPIEDHHYEEYEVCYGERADDDKVRNARQEIHALIYNDVNVALTMYEYCYSLWSLRDGTLLCEQLWYKKNKYRLSEKSLKMIKAGRYEV